jgi:hypothetical protein
MASLVGSLTWFSYSGCAAAAQNSFKRSPSTLGQLDIADGQAMEIDHTCGRADNPRSSHGLVSAMPNYDDSPEEAEAAIRKKSDAASDLDYAVACAVENLEFAESTLRYAREANNEAEFADAEQEREECVRLLAALREDYEQALQAVFAEQARWGF